ncbi:AAA family ATPase [Streptosporangium sp. KLBMP 9127]|nr:AAA family ATPase [Streptosporangium sp. KLBMP 9127]
MIIGIEGVSCTGKTTLANAIASQLANPLVVPCYYHVAPDPKTLPRPVAESAAEQLESLAILLRLEEMRRASALEACADGRDVILDRTADTLLAHAHAIGKLRSFDCDSAARVLVRDGPVVMPDLTLLLQAPAEVLAERAVHRPGMPRIFYDPGFAIHFNTYFRLPLVSACVVLDAAVSPEETLTMAMEAMRQAGHLGHRRVA